MNKNSPIHESLSKPFGEVIESHLTHYTAQCWEWDQSPSFGSLVSVKREDIVLLGIVSHIQTGSMDPMRYPFPYKKTEEELRKEQPQIFEFLKTTIQVTLLGHYRQSNVSYATPPHPAKIHSFVSPCTEQEIAAFFAHTDFLHTLFSAHEYPLSDNLFISTLSSLQENGLLTPELFTQLYETISLLTGNDYRRLKILLGRLSTELPEQTRVDFQGL